MFFFIYSIFVVLLFTVELLLAKTLQIFIFSAFLIGLYQSIACV